MEAEKWTDLSVKSLLDRLETSTFSAEVNVASGLGSFLSAVASHPTVLCLTRMTRETPLIVTDILERIRDLVNCRTMDPQYESPYDAALAAALVVIHRSVPERLTFAASLVQQARNTYWAARACADVLEEPRYLKSGTALILSEEKASA